MTKSGFAAGVALAALGVGVASAAGGASTPTRTGDLKLIHSAMGAAPRKVAGGAAVVVPMADGTLRTVRKGSNGFTCMPDNPATPGPDPMCMDAAGMAWAMAWLEHRDPPAGRVALMYMLAGGVDASNTDPYAERPAVKGRWVRTGPHLMVMGADAAFYDQYPKGATPDTRQPYVMWAGTPYQHLMVPVK